MAVKLTKNELKVQKDRLKQFQRYLPTLQLKKQQLQAVVMQVTAQLEQVEQQRRRSLRKTTASRRTDGWKRLSGRAVWCAGRRTSPASPYRCSRS